MPPKRPIQLQRPVPASDEEEEYQGFVSDQGSESKPESEELVGSEESESESGSHSKMKKNPSDVEESESESESEAGSHKPYPTVKPPMGDSAKKITSLKAGAGGGKRPAENEPKRAKKKLAVSEGIGAKMGEDQKRPLFQRLWSEDDEIVILKGIRDFVAKEGIDSLNNMNAFHDFIKKSLHVDVSTNQLQDKVRRLKKKFLNNVRKKKEGKDRIFSNPHEQKSYDMSKKIWSSDGKLLGLHSSKVNNVSARKNSAQRDSSKVNNVSARKNSAQGVGKSGPEEQSWARKSVEFGRSVGVGVGVAALEHEILNDGLECIEGSKRVELEVKWRTLRVEEYQLYLKKVELIQELTTLVLEAIKAQEED